VRSNSAGTLQMSTASTMLEVIKSSRRDGGEFTALNRFVVEDAQGRQQSLYVGDRKDSQVTTPRTFELPPAAPDFDARFSSQRMVETYDSPLQKPQQFRIDISSTQYPLTVSWELKKDTKERFLLTDVEGGKLVGSVVLNEKGSIKISDERVKSLMLRVEDRKQVPTEFAVRQSYPNPFNPSATIEFDLPKASRVTLKIFDVVGREVATLKDNEEFEAGTAHVTFDATNFSTGAYFYRIIARSEGKEFIDTKKMIFLR